MVNSSVIYLIVLELSCVYGFLFELQPQKANADCQVLFNCPTMCVGYDPMTLCPICTCGAPPASQAFQSLAPLGGQQQQYSYQSQSESASGTVQQTGRLQTMGGNLFQMFGNWGNNNVNQGKTNQLIPVGQGDNPANPNSIFPGMPLSGMDSIGIAASSQNQKSTTKPTLHLQSIPLLTFNPLGTQMSPTKTNPETLTTYKSTKLSASKPITATGPIPSKATPTPAVATLPTSGLSITKLPSILMTSPPIYLEKRQSVPKLFLSTINSSTLSTFQPLSSIISHTKTYTAQPPLTNKITRLSSSPTSSNLGFPKEPMVTVSSIKSTSTQKPLPILDTGTPTIHPQQTQTITNSSPSSASSTLGMTKKPAPIPNIPTLVSGSTFKQDKLAPSSPTSAPTPYVCPGVFICSLTCLTGYVNDAQGCPVCQCAEAPAVIP